MAVYGAAAFSVGSYFGRGSAKGHAAKKYRPPATDSVRCLNTDIVHFECVFQFNIFQDYLYLLNRVESLHSSYSASNIPMIFLN